MLTVTETSQRTLNSPEEIVAFLSEEYDKMRTGGRFAPGETVDIIKRDGIPSEMCVGDVGVVVFTQEAPSPFTHLLCVHQTGTRLVAQVQTANLAKRAAS